MGSKNYKLNSVQLRLNKQKIEEKHMIVLQALVSALMLHSNKDPVPILAKTNIKKLTH